MDNIAYARAQALQLIEQHGIKTAPVPIERIARALGVKVQYAPFDGEFVWNGVHQGWSADNWC